MGDEEIRVLIADAQPLFREAIRVVLEQAGIAVIADAGDAEQAAFEAERTSPDVAVVDAALPCLDGLGPAATIKQRAPHAQVLILAVDGDETALAEALESGASGYLTRTCGLSELLDAVRAVSRGETRVPSQMLGGLVSQLLQRRRDHDEALRRLSRLTRRERQVLALLIDCRDTNRIADVLVISPETARTHVQNVLSKLGVHSRPEAVSYVLATGVAKDLLAEPD